MEFGTLGAAASSPDTIASVKGDWTVAHANASIENTAGDATNPRAIDGPNERWLRVSDRITRALIRARYDDAVTTITASPVIQLIGAFGEPVDGAFPAGTRFMRLDNAESNASGTELTLAAASTQMQDGTHAYSDPISLDGYDLKGARYVTVVVTDAAQVSGGANTTVAIEMLGLN